MLISYPILQDGADSQTEEQRFAAALAMELLDEGVYPVSHDGRWHGGIHINTGSEPIRAIADGEVVCYRFTEMLENYPGQGEIDTSFVLLKHTTETGENTPVVFYSLYMHLMHKPALDTADLGQLPTFLREHSPSLAIVRPSNLRIYRKEVLGFGGMVYGRNSVMHFEIFTTDEHFDRFWRDSSIETRYGSDDVFGDMHFVVPVGTAFSARHPAAPATGTHRLDLAGANDLMLPAGTEGTNSEQLYVTVRLTQGRYVATTCQQFDGRTDQVGQPVEIENYEYELYRQSMLLYPDCPSAGYEWLRFGRVLGPEVTSRQQNIKLVRYAENAIGYVDLAQATIKVCSDADFPHWQYWKRLDEGRAVSVADGSVNASWVIQIINSSDEDFDQTVTPQELARHLTKAGNQHLRQKLRHLVIKTPTEWDDNDLEERYARLREEGKPLQDENSWIEFARHVATLTFWTDTGLPTSVWHFHPLQFVKQMKQCGWLSKNELLQFIPRYVIRKPGSHNSATSGYWESPSIANARTFLSLHAVELNKALKKFGIETPLRRACFMGNATQETAWFNYLRESNGSQPNLHLGWYGRGLLQLTNPNGNINSGNNNYYKYFRFLGRVPAFPPTSQELSWRDELGSNSYHAATSACVYWVWFGKSAPTLQNPGRPQVDNTNIYADQLSNNEARHD